MRTRIAVLLTSMAVLGITPASLYGQDAETEIRAVVQAQSAAFNRGDLDATMATLGEDVDWRTIGRQLIAGPGAVLAAMRGWIDGFGRTHRLVYPPESVSVHVLSPSYAVADVVLFWENADSGSGSNGST